jgi:hypothetical protein
MVKTRKKQQVPTLQRLGTLEHDALSSGVSKYLLVRVLDLTGEVENLGVDGMSAKVKKFVIPWAFHCPDAFFNGSLVWVQTAGTITQAGNIGYEEIDQIIAAQCDDEFGFEIARNISARFIPHNDFDANIMYYGVSGQTVVPQRILNLLNKETQTERSQSTFLCFVLQTSQASKNLYYRMGSVIDYTLTAKNISIR